jgi:hypothetical protein
MATTNRKVLDERMPTGLAPLRFLSLVTVRRTALSLKVPIRRRSSATPNICAGRGESMSARHDFASTRACVRGVHYQLCVIARSLKRLRIKARNYLEIARPLTLEETSNRALRHRHEFSASPPTQSPSATFGFVAHCTPRVFFARGLYLRRCLPSISAMPDRARTHGAMSVQRRHKTA